ncbi:NACHT domain-containing protein [Nocardiopsis dassonvillei]|uniref:hypothetical protein n=1 Tax=Nocardiopsis dassonvillei TaxID=2014 RepID=UPI00363E9685
MKEAFTQLSAPKIFGSPDKAWHVLRGTWIGWPSERDIVDGNAALASLLLVGAEGRLATAGLGDLVMQNLGVELSVAEITDRLPEYGLGLATVGRDPAVAEQVNACTDRWMTSVGMELLRPVVPRSEADQLVDLTGTGKEGLVFVVGAAGGGKTGVLHQAVSRIREQGTSVLAFRLDRLESFSSTTELGQRLGLEVSPVAALAAAAGDRASVLVIDQLDAVSIASGRMPRNFDVIAGLIRETTAFDRMRVVLACRKFDVDNDERIRGLSRLSDSVSVSVEPLTAEQVTSAIKAMGVDVSALSLPQRTLLRSPLHLVLLATVADEPNALDFESTAHLFDAYWDRKRRDVRERREGTRFASVASAVAEAISQRQRLSVPMTVLDRDDLGDDADVLISEHVLVRDGRQVAFFHEAFFDYTFARQWETRGESLVEFLTSGEQELFRRAQVRQIMTHLRDVDSHRFVDEVEELLRSNDVRFHIKDAVIAVLGGVADPTRAEGEMVLGVAANNPTFERTLWAKLRTAEWFARFDADGHICTWLRGGSADQARALDLMGLGARVVPDRVAELLAEHEQEPISGQGLRWVSRFADLDQSRSLFDLTLNAVRAGYYNSHEAELWMSLRDVEKKRPDWAIEMLMAYLVERPEALAQNNRGKVAVLEERDRRAIEFVKEVAARTPWEFCDALLPYLLQVINLTASVQNSHGLLRDAHFSYRMPERKLDSTLEDALLSSMVGAIRTLASRDPLMMRPTLERLSLEPYESAQWLLYQGFASGGPAYAEWAAERFLEDQNRLLSGYISNGVWTTREVLQAISPHINADLFAQLEDRVRDLRFPWEGRFSGWYAFCLLSALEESRLSETGRRRIGEFRRAYRMEQPTSPQGVTVGFVGSPIDTSSVELMSDDNWLQAMARYKGDEHNWETMTGGATELSHVLRERTKQDPDRFARLALRFTEEINPAYGNGILIGVGEADPIGDRDTVLAAVRHFASLGHAENDRWLGSAIRPYMKTIPLDIVVLIRDRMISSSDPSDDGNRVRHDDGYGRQVSDILMSGFNTTRGSLSMAMGDLLAYDTDGTRTEIVVPVLDRMATDPSVPVRACVARLIRHAARHAPEEATRAFWKLVETHDLLLSTEHVIRLVTHVGNQNPATVRPLIERMLSSEDDRVHESGGLLAAFAAMEWDMEDLLTAVLDSGETKARKGAASMCAQMLPHTSNVQVGVETLVRLANDCDEVVRRQASDVAGELRGHALRPFKSVLEALMVSPAFVDAVPQLLITLEQAPDQVDDLVLLCAQRFIEVSGADANDIRTGAAGDAREVGELIIRGLAQSRSAAKRSALLDVLDSLLAIGAYGVNDLIDAAAR